MLNILGFRDTVLISAPILFTMSSIACLKRCLLETPRIALHHSLCNLRGNRLTRGNSDPSFFFSFWASVDIGQSPEDAVIIRLQSMRRDLLWRPGSSSGGFCDHNTKEHEGKCASRGVVTVHGIQKS